jgi:hypothetical protein
MIRPYDALPLKHWPLESCFRVWCVTPQNSGHGGFMKVVEAMEGQK